MLDVTIQRDIIPQADLRLQGGWERWLKLGTDISPQLAILAAQGPLSPKLVTCDDEGRLNLAGVSNPIGFLGNLWPGGFVNENTVSDIVDTMNMENLAFLVQSNHATTLRLDASFDGVAFFDSGLTLAVLNAVDQIFNKHWPWRYLRLHNLLDATMTVSVQAKLSPL